MTVLLPNWSPQVSSCSVQARVFLFLERRAWHAVMRRICMTCCARHEAAYCLDATVSLETPAILTSGQVPKNAEAGATMDSSPTVTSAAEARR